MYVAISSNLSPLVLGMVLYTPKPWTYVAAYSVDGIGTHQVISSKSVTQLHLERDAAVLYSQ